MKQSVKIEFNHRSNQGAKLSQFALNSYLKQEFTDCDIYCYKNSCFQTEPSTSLLEDKYRRFRCHRLVLASRSEFFRFFFNSSQSESNSVCQKASLFLEMDPNLFDQILQLIYSDTVEIYLDDLDSFHHAATKLGLKDFSLIEDNSHFNLRNSLKSQTKTNEESEYYYDSSPQVKTSNKRLKPLQKEEANDKNKTTASLKTPNLETEMIDLGLVGTSGGYKQTELNDGNNNTTGLQSFVSKNSSLTSEVVSHQSSSTALNPKPTSITTNQKTSTTESSFTCFICQKQYNYSISLNKHMKSAHPTSNHH